MSKKAYEYQEDICNAIRTIVQAELNDTLYDKSITCVITDDSKREEGCYTVTDGSVKFDAYSALTSYRNDDQVLVSIQQGDFDLQKTIIRKITPTNSDAPVAYVPPLGTMLNMTENLFEAGYQYQYNGKGQPFSIRANDPTDGGKVKTIWEYKVSEDTRNVIKNNSFYEVIGLKASFKTLLGTRDYDIRQGNYGLYLDIDYLTNQGTESETLNHAHYVLDSQADMFGDPYNFQVYFSQSKKIDISNLGTITYMRLSLYQLENFEYLSDKTGKMEKLPWTYKSLDNALHLLPPNIFVDKIELSFGLDVVKMQDNVFMLYTTDPPGYIDAESNKVPITFTPDYNVKHIYSMWCNKDENNEYLGFSDGIYDPSYDEDEYLNEYEKQAKGLTLRGRVAAGGEEELKCPPQLEALQLYADAFDMNDSFQIIHDYINDNVNGLWRQITNLRSKLIEYKIDFSIIDEIFKSVCTWSTATNSLDMSGKLKDLNTFLLDVGRLKNETSAEDNEIPSQLTIIEKFLAKYYEYYNKKKEDEKYTFAAATSPSTIITANKNKLINIWEALAPELKAIIENCYSKAVAENPNVKAQVEKFDLIFNDEIIKLSNHINSLLNLIDTDRIDKLIAAVHNRIKNNDLTTIEEDYQTFVDENANRYCIYWYQYEKGYEDPNERHVEKGWKRIATGLGLPKRNSNGPSIEINGTTYKYYNVLPTNNVYTANMNVKKQEEKFKGILFFNHIAYKSEEVVFTNDVEVVDSTTADTHGALYIELGENSSDSYQLYGVDNYLINRAEGITRRQVRVRYQGEDQGDEALIGTQIFWYLPTNSTMLTWDSGVMARQGFSTLSMTKDINQDEFEKSGYECFYKTIKATEDGTLNINDTYFYYRIKDYYNITASNNTIMCIVKSGVNIYQAEYTFAFTSFGTTGTDYTLAITPFTTQSSIQIIDNKVVPMKIQSEFFDYNNNPVVDEHTIMLDWAYDSTNGVLDIETYYPYYYSNGKYRVVHYTDPDDADSCYDESGKLKVDKDYYYCYPTDPAIDDKGWVINSNNYTFIEIDYSEAKRATLDTKRLMTPSLSPYKDYYNVLKGEVYWDKLGENEDAGEGEDAIIKADQTLILTSFFPVPTSSGDYYIEGASNVIYDSLGKNPSYYKEPYKIYDSKTQEEITDVHWVLEFYKDNNGVLVRQNKILEDNGIDVEYPIFDSKDLDLTYDEDAGYKRISVYLPQIKSESYTEIKEDGAKTKTGYFLRPINMYVEKIGYYCVAMCYSGKPYTADGTQTLLNYYKNRKFLWAQPILISQNRYSSAMLNKWDESLTIDEENGIILSTMMGAGYKDEYNQFNGVLMGDTRVNTEIANNLTGVGLYGFNKGAQSFAWDINGKGFIGKSGHGRLWFDGDTGAIFSESYQFFKTDEELEEEDLTRTGMLIDFDDGLIQMYGLLKETDEEGNILHNPTQSEVRISVEAPYFVVQDEGGYDLCQDAEYDKELTYYKIENGTYVEVDLNSSDGEFEEKYEPGVYYIYTEPTKLIYIGQQNHSKVSNYYLQSHNYTGLADGEDNWQVVNDPVPENLYYYYEQVPTYIIDTSNAYISVKDSPYNNISYYLYNAQNKIMQVRVYPMDSFNTFTIYSNYILATTSSYDANIQYYVKNENSGYTEVIINQNIYEPNKYYTRSNGKSYFLYNNEYNADFTYYSPVYDESEKEIIISYTAVSVDENNFISGKYYIYNYIYTLITDESYNSSLNYYEIVNVEKYIYKSIDLIINKWISGKYYYKDESEYEEIPNTDKFTSSINYYIKENGTYKQIYFYLNNYFYLLKYIYQLTEDTSINNNKIYYTPRANTGLKIDLENGLIEGYNLKLIGHGSYAKPTIEDPTKTEIVTGDFIIDTSVKDINGYPLRIGSNFKVSWNGDMYANSGQIGGWHILNNRLISNKGTVGLSSYTVETTGVDAPAFWATNSDSIDDAPYDNDGSPIEGWEDKLDFYVTRQGKLKATKATIEGTITANYLSANSGTIGGWKINKSSLSAGKTVLNSNGTIIGAYISGGTVSGAYISGGTVSGSTIKGATITGGSLYIGSGMISAGDGYVTINGWNFVGSMAGNTSGWWVCENFSTNHITLAGGNELRKDTMGVVHSVYSAATPYAITSVYYGDSTRQRTVYNNDGEAIGYTTIPVLVTKSDWFTQGLDGEWTSSVNYITY